QRPSLFPYTTLFRSGRDFRARLRAVRPRTNGSLTMASAQASGDAAEKPSLLFFHSAASGRCRRVEGFMAQVLQRRSNHETFKIRSEEHTSELQSPDH